MEPYQSDLLIKTLLLVGSLIVGGALSAYILRKNFSWYVILGSFALTILLIFVNKSSIMPSNNVSLMVPFNLLFGAAWGADLGGFAIAVATRKNKVSKVPTAIILTFGVMAFATLGAALIGLFTGFNFQGLTGVMIIGIFVLIGISILGIAFRFNKIIEGLIGLGASIFWIIFMVIDFNKIITVYTESSWSAAQAIAVQIYADLVNLFVRLFPIILDLLD